MTATRSALLTLHEGKVQADEIDELGHLSVPFYELRARTASQNLLKQCGLDQQADKEANRELTFIDGFSRNLREQFLGADLAVQGGVLHSGETRVQLYQQIVNIENNEVAAVYVHNYELQNIDTRAAVLLEASFRDSLNKVKVTWPEHGHPRSLDLSKAPYELDLTEARHRDLATRPPRRIEADECNEEGFLEPDNFQHLPYSGAESEDPTLQWVFELADGTRVGLADLESRTTLHALPRENERVQVFSAEVAIARKTIQRSYWVYSLDSQALLSTASVVMACLDLDARKALLIEGPLRDMFNRRYHPDLA